MIFEGPANQPVEQKYIVRFDGDDVERSMVESQLGPPSPRPQYGAITPGFKVCLIGLIRNAVRYQPVRKLTII